MLAEKKKLIVFKTVVTLLALAIMISSVCLMFVPKLTTVDIQADEYVMEYDEDNDTSLCRVEITFDEDPVSGYLTVDFYNADGKKLEHKRKFYEVDGDSLVTEFNIEGDVYRCKVASYQRKGNPLAPKESYVYFIIFNLLVIAVWICVFSMEYRVYDNKSNKIIVYAGLIDRYIKIDGVKLDEYKSLFHFNKVSLSCTLEDGTNICATISPSNRISLKINDKLFAPLK